MTYFAMIFLHIINDFFLQGILASMKQKAWWRNQEGYKDMYQDDYIVALMMHSFSWAFMIMLPIYFAMKFELSWFYIIALFVNVFIHSIVDDLKANKMKISLFTDQTIHLCQITWTYAIFRIVI